jgi:hypothetical protein
MPDANSPHRGSVAKGAWLAVGAAIGAVVLILMGGDHWPRNAQGVVLGALLGIGAVQALWVVPLWLYYRRAGETETVRGILGAAGVIFLLNAGCWGIVAGLR